MVPATDMLETGGGYDYFLERGLCEGIEEKLIKSLHTIWNEEHNDDPGRHFKRQNWKAMNCKPGECKKV